MIRILMVCLGNICRSPLAHGILDSKLDSNFFIIERDISLKNQATSDGFNAFNSINELLTVKNNTEILLSAFF